MAASIGGAEIHQVFVFLKLKFPGLGNDVKAVIGPLNISSVLLDPQGIPGHTLIFPRTLSCFTPYEARRITHCRYYWDVVEIDEKDKSFVVGNEKE